TELDQVALPILLAWRLGVAGCLDHDPYPTMVRPAAQFILREGPLTTLDRWEDAGGLSPSTLATCIAALIVAGEFAHDAGEQEDGAPWDGSGRGRAWPVLTAERARHFFSMGLPAAEMVRTLEGFAGQGLALAEQMWDGPDIPSRRLQFGKPNGSACPLGWAHAEYLELLVTIALGGFPDIVMPARRRYTEGPAQESAFVWSHRHQIGRIVAGRRLRVQLPRPGAVHYTFDQWESFTEIEAVDTTLGVWV